MNAKKAAKLDMDDRAKILQYFSRPVGAAGDIAGRLYLLKWVSLFNYIMIFQQKLFYYGQNAKLFRCGTKC